MLHLAGGNKTDFLLLLYKGLAPDATLPQVSTFPTQRSPRSNFTGAITVKFTRQAQTGPKKLKKINFLSSQKKKQGLGYYWERWAFLFLVNWLCVISF